MCAGAWEAPFTNILLGREVEKIRDKKVEKIREDKKIRPSLVLSLTLMGHSLVALA